MLLLQKDVVPITHHRLVAQTSDHGANTLHRALQLFVALVPHQDGIRTQIFNTLRYRPPCCSQLLMALPSAIHDIRCVGSSNGDNVKYNANLCERVL